MKPYDPNLPLTHQQALTDTEAQRQHQERQRNKQRLKAWRQRFVAATGREPAKPTPPTARNVIRMPTMLRSVPTTHKPEGPEAA